jgi:hypothetical protein
VGTFEIRNGHNIFSGKSEGKGPLGKHRHNIEDNINLSIYTKVRWRDRNRWKNRLNRIMNRGIPQKLEEFLCNSTTVIISKLFPMKLII